MHYQVSQPVMMAQVIAQVIPSADGTGTVIDRTGNNIDVTGGSTSRNGENLFHSLEKLGIKQEEVLNFQSSGAVRNIFTRVRGGEASILDGLLKVSGSRANLFLMNPAGFLFGPNIRLQLPGSFTATTATDIQFEGGLFNAGTGVNYSDLIGNPTGFLFALSQPGAIVNSGSLDNSGSLTASSINLIAGQVTNTGSIKGDKINLVAVEGNREVRLGQDGRLLSLALKPSDLPALQNWTPSTLPQILAQGQGIQNAPALTVSPTGEVSLSGSGLQVGTTAGTAVLSGGINGEEVTVQADRNLTVYSGDIAGFDFGAGRPVVLKAGEKFFAGSRVRTAGRSIAIEAPNIETQEISTVGTLEAEGNIQLTGLAGELAASVKTGTLFTPGRGIDIFGKNIETGFIITTIGTKSEGEIRVRGVDQVKLGGVLSYRQDLSAISEKGLLKSGVIVTYGGDVSLRGDRIDASFIWTTPEAKGNAGNIVVESQGDLTVRQVEAIGNRGAGGDVKITSATGDAVISSIQAYGEGSGNVLIKGDRVQITGVAESKLADGQYVNSSIRTDGSVTVEHSGGKRNLPFLIGDKFYNGTAGSIIAGSSIINQGSFRIKRSDRTEQVETLTVTSKNQTPRFPDNSNQLFQKNVVPGQQVNFSLAELGVGEPIDPENDQTQIYLRLKNPSARSGQIVDQFGRIVDGTRPLGRSDRLTYLAPERGGIVADGFEMIVLDVPLEPGEDAFAGAVGRSATLELVFNSRNIIPLVEPAALEAQNSKAEPTAGTSGLSEVSAADVASLDKGLTKEYTDAGIGSDIAQSTENPLDLVKRIQTESGVKSGLVYLTLPPGSNRPLELTLVTARGAYRKRLTAPQWEILQQAAVFRAEVTNPLRTSTKSYMASARKLHRWMIDPLRSELTAQGIQNLIFLPQGTLRSIPFAALHDGNRFLVEEFGIGIMPSVSLTQTKYQDVKQASVFAAGISEAVGGQIALPMVQGEIGAIAQLWPKSNTVLNQGTTLSQLQGARQGNPFRIVHLATHASFTAGNPKAAYIQLWDQRLQLEQLKTLNWNNPPVELLVLSACRTALGDKQAELGFAGIAVQSGVKSVVASLWYVNDTATSALSTAFYRQLSRANSKADALRLAQVGMLKGKIKPMGDKIVGLGDDLTVMIPEQASVNDADFRHPYYWAAFTLVGNPW